MKMKEEKKRCTLSDKEKFEMATRLKQDFGEEGRADMNLPQLVGKYSVIFEKALTVPVMRNLMNIAELGYASMREPKENGLDIIKLLARVEQLENRVTELESERVL